MTDVRRLARTMRFALIAVCFPFAAHAAPSCVDNLVNTSEVVTIDASTLLLHKPGEGYKRITLINHPLEPDDELLHRPYALCLGDRIAPLGVERGISIIMDIAGISTDEARAMKQATYPGRIDRPLPRNRINFMYAGRIAELCNDTYLTLFQIKQCGRMMREAQTADARSEIRETVRFIVKKRQTLSNRYGLMYTNEGTRDRIFGGVAAPPPAQAPQR